MTRWVWLVAAVVLAGALAAGYLLLGPNAQTTLSFDVRDAVSRSTVWDSTIRYQNRVIRGYLETSYRFTRLRPGTFELTVAAPGYEPYSGEVRVRRGSANTIPPISLVGYEIPGMARLAASAGRSADGMELHLNPLDAAGNLIKVFPCLDLRIAVRVTVQTKDGAPVSAPTTAGADRGAKLFEGQVGWSWNAAPDALYRYDALIASVPVNAARYVVVDYFVLMPDPRKISSRDVDALMNRILSANDPAALSSLLAPYLDKVKVESGTLWNVSNSVGP